MKKLIFIIPLLLLLLATSCSWPFSVDSNKPGIVAFTANPAGISPGQSTTLMWNVTNATTVQIDQGVGSGLAVAGTISVSPASTTTYKLTAINSSGSTETYITVSVSSSSSPSSSSSSGLLANPPVVNQNPPALRPNIVVFDISPNTINMPPGTGAHSATMRWEVKNAVNVTLNGSPVQPIGSQVLTPPVGTHNYVLRAFNPAGEDSKTQTLRVNP